MTDDKISDETPIPLKEAVRRAFPAGGMTVVKLRRRIEAGELKGYKVGQSVFTTMKWVQEMLDASVIKPPQRVDWHARHDPPDPFGRTPAEVAQERALAILAKPQNPKKPKQ